jgi:anaerobic selenocysteine-containing dehydrogenase
MVGPFRFEGANATAAECLNKTLGGQVIGKASAMGTTSTHKTACILCYVNCGLEVEMDGPRITKVRGDRENPRSRGYLCQKAARIPYYTQDFHRLTTPLRRTKSGDYEAIEWETAIREISEKLDSIRKEHGGSAFGYYGGGSQGNALGAPYGLGLMRAMGSSLFFNALAQEKTGDYWVNGKLFGSQMCHTAEDVEHAELFVVLGCNPWMANGFLRARDEIKTIHKDVARRMIVIDPRRTEVAELADLHLSLRPGTDAFLLGAILALIVRKDGEAREFLAERTIGFEEVRDALLKIPVDEWIAAADVPRRDVDKAVEMILNAGSMSVRVDVGLQQARNSTLNSYLEKLLFLLTGNFAKPGCNGIHTWLAPLIGHSKPNDLAPVTGQLKIAGLLPPNTLPAHILTDHPERMRAMVVDSANPANTAANTKLVEQAFKSLELLVVIDIAMTESARCAHYVLPAANQYEKWECAFFNYEYPNNFFHLRPPLLSPPEGTLVEAEIYTRLSRSMGDMPSDAVLADLREKAASDRPSFANSFKDLIRSNKAYAGAASSILYETLGKTLPRGAEHVAALWPVAHRCAADIPDAVRSAGIEGEGFDLGENLFEQMLSQPSGFTFSRIAYDKTWDLIRHPDQKVRLAIPEMLDWLAGLKASDVQPDPDFPLMLIAGQRRHYNANQIIRNPRWRKNDPEGALHLHPTDLAASGGQDGGWMVVETKVGRIVTRVGTDPTLRLGQASLPHGFGQVFDLPRGQVTVGPRLNVLTDCDDCDPLTKTPHHKNVAIRITPAGVEEIAAMERQLELIAEIA